MLRVVRVLPDAVKIGSSSSDDGSEEENAAGILPEERSADLPTQLTEEISRLKARVAESEAENRELAARAGVIERELAGEREHLAAERKKMKTEMEAEGRSLRKKSASEGFEEGRKAGYDEGIENARQEAAREYERKISSLVTLLEGVHAALAAEMEALASLQMPRLVRMWELLLSRMLRREVALDEGIAFEVLRGVLERLSDRERILVYVNPADADQVSKRKDVFGDLLRGVKHLEFIPDGNVDEGSCIVETNLGIYDARWRTQLEQIGQEIDRLFIEGRKDGSDAGID